MNTGSGTHVSCHLRSPRECRDGSGSELGPCAPSRNVNGASAAFRSPDVHGGAKAGQPQHRAYTVAGEQSGRWCVTSRAGIRGGQRARTQRTPRRPIVPDKPRPTAQPRRRRVARHHARRHSTASLPLDQQQNDHATRTTSLLRDDPIAGRRGHLRDRALARPREDRHRPEHADLAVKERALARTAPRDAVPGHYQPPDTLLVFLEAL